MGTSPSETPAVVHSCATIVTDWLARMAALVTLAVPSGFGTQHETAGLAVIRSHTVTARLPSPLSLMTFFVAEDRSRLRPTHLAMGPSGCFRVRLHRSNRVNNRGGVPRGLRFVCRAPSAGSDAVHPWVSPRMTHTLPLVGFVLWWLSAASWRVRKLVNLLRTFAGHPVCLASDDHFMVLPP